MSSDIVIRAEGLGKKYMIGHQSGERYTSLRDVIAQTARNFARSAGDMFSGKAIIAGDEVEEFWALKDVSFEIKRGDVVGIIGRNGAGKSTLLKVLSRITEPSEGRVEIKGRVASLLEVGTGFHPELTGRENIYLNGAILGMSREEIKRKFDEIVDFSGVEKFLDTPVKRYSSGMYVRLAFAVAAHLEPEILIVDEVLAVGDAEFQKKCLGKMQDVAGHGRTVLFVSHNMGAVQSICKSAIVFVAGRVSSIGAAHQQVRQYLESSHLNIVSRADFPIQFEFDSATCNLSATTDFLVASECWGKLSALAIILNHNGHRVAVVDLLQGSNSLSAGQIAPPHDKRNFDLDLSCLIPGRYHLDVFADGTLHSGDILDLHTFEITDTIHLPFAREFMGIIKLQANWR